MLIVSSGSGQENNAEKSFDIKFPGKGSDILL
jgi:hypothetical protein